MNSSRAFCMFLLFYIVCISEIKRSFAEAFQDVRRTGVFNFDDKRSGSCLVEITEYGIEAYHSALTDLLLVLDEQVFKSARVFLHVLDRTCSADDCPIYIYLEEYILR